MKTHKKIKFAAAFIGLITLLPFSSIAQGHYGRDDMGDKKGKLKTYKIAFLTDRLELTPAEAEKFWPVYNEHEAAMETFHKDFRKSHPFEPEDIDAMSEADANVFIKQHLDHELQVFEMQKAFLGKLNGVIPAKKILLLMEAEKDFRVEVVRKMAGKDGPPMPGNEDLKQNPDKK
jgi:hypothetical protein